MIEEGLTLSIESLEDTVYFGRVLAESLRGGDLIGLSGDLGAGKTFLVQQVAIGLNVPAEIRVTSPTFTLINEYRGGRLDMYHADLYRLEKERELDELGLHEHCRDENGIVFVEWCDRFPAIPADHLLIDIQIMGDFSRRICLAANGPDSSELLSSIREKMAARCQK